MLIEIYIHKRMFEVNSVKIVFLPHRCRCIGNWVFLAGISWIATNEDWNVSLRWCFDEFTWSRCYVRFGSHPEEFRGFKIGGIQVKKSFVSVNNWIGYYHIINQQSHSILLVKCYSVTIPLDIKLRNWLW